MVPGGEGYELSSGYRLRFDCAISVKLVANVYVAPLFLIRRYQHAQLLTAKQLFRHVLSRRIRNLKAETFQVQHRICTPQCIALSFSVIRPRALILLQGDQLQQGRVRGITETAAGPYGRVRRCSAVSSRILI